MNPTAERHLAKAKGLIARGDEFYRQAAVEIHAARDIGATWNEINDYFGRGRNWAERIVAWDKTPANDVAGTRTPFSEPTGAVAVRHTRSMLRQAKPSEIAEDLLSDPDIRRKIQQAQDVASNKMVRDAQHAERKALGDDASDALVHQQTLRNAEGELFKARRAVIQTLRLLDAARAELDDPWREEFLRTFDDIIEKCELGRDVLAGDLQEGIEQLLASDAR